MTANTEWMKTPEGRAILLKNAKKARAALKRQMREKKRQLKLRKRKRGPYRKATKEIKPLITKRRVKNEKHTLTVYYHNPNGGIDVGVHKIHDYADIVKVLYGEYNGINVIEARYV